MPLHPAFRNAILLAVLLMAIEQTESFRRRQPPPQQPPQPQQIRRSGLPAIDSGSSSSSNNFNHRRIQNFPPPPHKFRGKPPFPFGRRRPPPPHLRNYHRQPPPQNGQLLLPLPSNEPSQGPPQLSFHIPPAPPTSMAQAQLNAQQQQNGQLLQQQSAPLANINGQQNMMQNNMQQNNMQQNHMQQNNMQQNNNNMQQNNMQPNNIPQNNMQQNNMQNNLPPNGMQPNNMQQGGMQQQHHQQQPQQSMQHVNNFQQHNQQQTSFANPILEYAPPPNSFNVNNNKESSEKLAKQTITFTVTPKPAANGGNLIQFHISTPKPYKASLKSNSKEYYSGSTLRPPSDGGNNNNSPTPGYPNTEYRVNERDREELRPGQDNFGRGSYDNPVYVSKNPSFDNKLESYDNHYNGASISHDLPSPSRQPDFGGPTNRPDFGGPTNRPDFGGPTNRPDFGPTNRLEFGPNSQFGGPTNRPDFGPDFSPSKRPDFDNFGINGRPDFGPTNRPDFGPTNKLEFGPTGSLPEYGPTNGLPEYGPTNRSPDFGPTNRSPDFGPTNRSPDFGPTNRSPDFGPTQHSAGDFGPHSGKNSGYKGDYNNGPSQRPDHHHSSHNNGPTQRPDFSEHSFDREEKPDFGESHRSKDYYEGKYSSHERYPSKEFERNKQEEKDSKYSQPDPLYHPEGDVVKSSEVRDMKPPPRFDNSYSSDYNKKEGSAASGSGTQQILHKQLAAEEVLAALGLSTNPLVNVPSDLSASGSNNGQQQVLTPPMPWEKSEYSAHSNNPPPTKQAEPLNLMDYLKLKEEEENGREALLKNNDKLVDSFVMSASMLTKPNHPHQQPNDFKVPQNIVFGRPLKNFGPDSIPDSASIETEKELSPSPSSPFHNLQTPIDRKDTGVSLGVQGAGSFNSYIHQKLYSGNPHAPKNEGAGNMGHSMTASPPSSLYGPTASASEVFPKLSLGPGPSSPSLPANFIPPQQHSLYVPPVSSNNPFQDSLHGSTNNHRQSQLHSLVSAAPSYIPPSGSYGQPPLNSLNVPLGAPVPSKETISYIQHRLNGNPLAGIPPPPPSQKLYEPLYEGALDSPALHHSHPQQQQQQQQPPSAPPVDRYSLSLERGDYRDGGLSLNHGGPPAHGILSPPPPPPHPHHNGPPHNGPPHNGPPHNGPHGGHLEQLHGASHHQAHLEHHGLIHHNEHSRLGLGPTPSPYDTHFGATARYGEPYPVYVTEPDPIIEIIVQDSNVTLPPLPTFPPPPPPPPPTPEPVHVFYVRYSQNKSYDNHYEGSEPQIKLETPVASIPVRGPNRDLEVDGGHHGMQQNNQQFLMPQQGHQQFSSPPQQQQQPSPSQHHPQIAHLTTTEAPPTTTTLRTVIRPDKNEYTPSKLGVAFDHPPEVPMFQDLAQQQSQQINQQFQSNFQQNTQQSNTQESGNPFQFQQPLNNQNNQPSAQQQSDNNAFQQALQNILQQHQDNQLQQQQNSFQQQQQQQQNSQQNQFQQQQPNSQQNPFQQPQQNAQPNQFQQQQNPFQQSNPFQQPNGGNAFQQPQFPFQQQPEQQQNEQQSPFQQNVFQNSGEPQQNQVNHFQNSGEPGQNQNPQQQLSEDLITFPQLSNQDLSQLDKLWTESGGSSSSSSHEYKPSPVYNFNRRMGLQELASLLDVSDDSSPNNNPTSQQQEQSTEAPKLPEDVPEELKQQLVNSGILGNADVQVINFDENLFKELSDLPPEALTALSQQYPSLEKSKRSVKNILILKNSQRPKRTNRSRRLVMIVTETDSFIYNPRKKFISRVATTSAPVQRALELSHHHHY